MKISIRGFAVVVSFLNNSLLSAISKREIIEKKSYRILVVEKHGPVPPAWCCLRVPFKGIELFVMA